MSEQRSQDWFAERLGRATASRISDVIAKTRNGWGASRANYMAELVVERISGKPYPTYNNAAMQWGTDTEAEAVIAYECIADVDAIPVGFVTHPTILMSGASPDRLVGADGSLEVKCPNSGTHYRTLRGEPITGEYMTQIYWQMACTGRLWTDWVSYDPRMPGAMQIVIRRVMRDDAKIAELEKLVSEFLVEVDREVAALKLEYESKEAA